MPSFTFKKEEKLKRRKVIQGLFKEGQSFGQYPLRLVWMEVTEREGTFPVQFTASVPKKRYKKAVDRNKLKRKIREAYRLHKHKLYRVFEGEDKQYAFMVIYVAKEQESFAKIEWAMKKMIRRFTRDFEVRQLSANHK